MYNQESYVVHMKVNLRGERDVYVHVKARTVSRAKRIAQKIIEHAGYEILQIGEVCTESSWKAA